MKQVVIIYHNHLDPEWARCYDRPLMWNSIILRSYADVWDFIISNWLDLVNDGFQYTEGQNLVLRTYLRRHPEKTELIKKLIQEHKLEILLQGELTLETNYVPAEGLARNYLLAKKFYDEFCGNDYPGTKIAWIWDAFGNSANMPQVLKLAGAEVVGGTKYRPCPGDYWVGIDGTKLPCIDTKFGTDDSRSVHYGLSRHVHCDDCKGYGCEKCKGWGMVSKHPFIEEEVYEFLEAASKSEEEVKFVMIGGEEVLPNRCILNAMEKLNKKYRGQVEFRFGSISEYWEYNKSYFESVKKDYTEPTEDLNPVHQGCYVTRIENKQRTRSITYALIQAETEIAAKMWKKGTVEPVPEELTLAWQNLLLNMHHDSISGAHIDAGQAELMDYLDESESIAYHYIPNKANIKAKRIEGVDVTHAGICTKKLGKMQVTYDKNGIISIKKDEKDLFGSFKYKNMTFTRNQSDHVHIGELLLQCEWGDNHNTYFPGDYVMLGKYNYSVYDNSDHIWWRGKYETGDPNVNILEWEIRVQASPDGERLDFITEVTWDTFNKRLRVAIPVNDTRKDSIWEIPYGFIKREFDPDNILPFSPVHRSLATRPIGEFPVLHWVRHDIDEKSGVAILNKGIPSFKWIPGCFEISLLRSPTMTGDTVLPSVDEIWDVDGTRDTGRHRFEYSIWPYTNGLTNSQLTRVGYEYNDASPKVPFIVEGDIVITTFKVAESGDGFILRVQEANGTNSMMKLVFDDVKKIIPVNIMEEPCGEIVQDKKFEYILHKHEILTLLIK